MPTTLLPNDRSRPSPGLYVNTALPISKGLVSAINFPMLKNLAGPTVQIEPAISGDASDIDDAWQEGSQGAGTRWRYGGYEIATPAMLANNEMSILLWLYPSVVDDTDYWVWHMDSGSIELRMHVESGTPRWRVTSSYPAGVSHTRVVDVPELWIATITDQGSGGSVNDVWLNGRLIDSVDNASQFTAPSATNLHISRDSWDSDRLNYWTAQVWNRALTRTEIAQLFDDPWAVWRRPNIVQFPSDAVASSTPRMTLLGVG